MVGLLPGLCAQDASSIISNYSNTTSRYIYQTSSTPVPAAAQTEPLVQGYDADVEKSGASFFFLIEDIKTLQCPPGASFRED